MDHWRRTVIEAGKDGDAFLDMTPGELTALAIVQRDRREVQLFDLAKLALMHRRTIWEQKNIDAYSLLDLLPPPPKPQTADDWERELSRADGEVSH